MFFHHHLGSLTIKHTVMRGTFDLHESPCGMACTLQVTKTILGQGRWFTPKITALRDTALT